MPRLSKIRALQIDGNEIVKKYLAALLGGKIMLINLCSTRNAAPCFVVQSVA